MTTEEDNFDIDIYGEGGGEEYDMGLQAGDSTQRELHESVTVSEDPQVETGAAPQGIQEELASSNEHIAPQRYGGTTSQESLSQDPDRFEAIHLKGVKRKDSADDRPIDPGATGALFISDLPWWITDDDIRGWADQGGCEDELEEITFSEHKVNGKSKGQAYALFTTPQAATATKRLVETFGDGQKYKQKFTSNYTNPLANPFKTLPKDGNTRSGGQGMRATSGAFASASGQAPSGLGQSGYRGRGGYSNNSRGSMGGYTRGGYNQSTPGNYQGGAMSNFQGGMQQYGGFQGRGGMMGGIRGGSMGMRGRGSMGNMMNMPMGGMMGMGSMAGQMPNIGMGMPGMNASMGMQGMTGRSYQAFLPAFAPPDMTLSPGKHGTRRNASSAPYQSMAHSARGRANVDASFSSDHKDIEKMQAKENQPLNRGYDTTGSGFQTPSFFPQQIDNWNPHGAKRTRQE